MDGFGPPPTEFGFRILDMNGEALADYPTDLPLRRCWQWVGPYDRQVCRSLAFALWEKVLGDFKNSGTEASPSEALRFLIEASGRTFPSDVPAKLLAQAVTAVGDSGTAEELAKLRALAREMPPPDEHELAWEAARAEWQELRTGSEKIPWQVRRERRDAYESAQTKVKNLLAWQLRERMPRALKQIDLINADDAMLEYASRPESDPAIWCLRRLEEQNPEAAVAALESVYFHGAAKWRNRILSYRAQTDLDAVKTLYLALPAEERIPLVRDFFRIVSDKASGEKWVEPLLQAIESDEVPPRTRVICLQLLVRPYRPLQYPDPKIAERLEVTLQRELKKDADEADASLLNALIKALILRNQTKNLFRYADEAWTRYGEGNLECSAFSALIHLAHRGLPPEETERLWEHFDPSRSDVRAKRKNYVGYAYKANLREAREVLQRLATRAPDEVETTDYGRARPLIRRGREHYARQLLAVWDEPDLVTRVKCLIVFGMQTGAVSFTYPRPRPQDVALGEFNQYLEEMSPAERNSVAEFIKWLDEEPSVQRELKRNHYSRHFLHRIREKMEK